jgi:hypothetical protein
MKREDRKVKCEGSCGWEGKMGDAVISERCSTSEGDPAVKETP